MSSQLLSITGAVLFIHAAYSCMTYRELVQELLESGASNVPDPESPPTDVLLEVALGFVILLVGEFSREGSMLRPIQTYQNTRPLSAPVYITRDFDIYTTRAKGL